MTADRIRALIVQAEREGLKPVGVILGPMEELHLRWEVARFCFPSHPPEALPDYGPVTAFLGLPVRLAGPGVGVALEFGLDAAGRLLEGVGGFGPTPTIGVGNSWGR